MARPKPASRKGSPKIESFFYRLGITPKRLGVFALILIFGGILSSWIVWGQGYQKTTSYFSNQFLQITSDAGFIVDDILIEGRENTDLNLIKQLININRGDPIFALDPKGAREALEKISWVKHASVTRALPDKVKIVLTERTPLALWQHGGKVGVIDKDGEVLTYEKLKKFQDYLLLVGEDAALHAQDFMLILSSEPIVAKYVDSAIRVGGRRWDLNLDNGVMVKLPEEDMPLALSQLAKMQEEEKIFSKDIKSIDLRQRDRIMIRTRPGRVQEYTADQKGI